MAKARLIGDSLLVAPDVYNQYLTISEAQDLVDWLSTRLSISNLGIRVLPARPTKWRHGRADRGKNIIYLNKPSKGAVIHEMAHILCNEHGHGYNFKRAQVKLYKIVYGIS